MVYIRTDENNMVVFTHNQPFDSVNGMGETREELEKTGYFLDSMPNPTVVMGQRAIPYYNPETHKVTYKYVAVPLSTKERLDTMEAAFNEMLLNVTMEVPNVED